MTDKQPGRNDPCPCGSGKKFKQCCWLKNPTGKRKIKATWISGQKPVDLMERTFGNGIAKTKESDRPSLPPESGADAEKSHSHDD